MKYSRVVSSVLSVIVASWLLLFPQTVAAAPLQAVDLQVENIFNPLGVDVTQPRLRWRLSTSGTNVVQLAYQIIVSDSARRVAAGHGDLWDSGKIASDDSIGVVYGGPVLLPERRYYWSVKVWDNHGNVSHWTKPAWWEMGLLGTSDWSGALWIVGTNRPAAPLLRTAFNVTKCIAQARLYVTAAGYYVATINGKRVGSAVLDPGFTDYARRSLYATYDVTRQLQRGTNVLGATLGRGFYAIDISRDIQWWDGASWLSREPKLLAKLAITYTDGTHKIITTGTDWKSKPGPTVLDSMYRGESFDARLSPQGWDEAGFNANGWENALACDAPNTNLQAQLAEPIRVTGTAVATEITQPKPGIFVYKFPVMLAGWARLSVSGPAGTKITLRLGEKLNDDGTVNNMGDPGITAGEIQKFEYTLAGKRKEVWEPEFTYAGFQYVQVENFPGTPDTNSILACEVHSDVPATGDFSCSNPLLNRIHDICRRTVLNNIHSIPTDTPTYEKRGWTGDTLCFSAFGIDNFGMQRFFEKWMYDLADTQKPTGEISIMAPSPFVTGDPSWCSAFVVIPWRLYQEYGDRTVLVRHYEEMKRLVDSMSRRATNNLVNGNSYDWWVGDWVSPGYDSPPEGPFLMANANYYHDVVLLSQMAGIVGHPSDQIFYGDLAAAIKKSFNELYLDPVSGIYRTTTTNLYRQSSSAVPLNFGLVPLAQIPNVVSNLVADIRLRGNHLNTGCIGTAALLPALTENGQVNLAYAIATQTTYPSWGWWLSQGATTAWEQWIGGTGLRSRDHAFLGTIDDWFFKYLVGIQPAGPGYREINIKPYLPDQLRSASASIKTPMGTVASDWIRNESGSVILNVEIPPNARAHVWVPGWVSAIQVGSGSYTFRGLVPALIPEQSISSPRPKP